MGAWIIREGRFISINGFTTKFDPSHVSAIKKKHYVRRNYYENFIECEQHGIIVLLQSGQELNFWFNRNQKDKRDEVFDLVFQEIS